MRHFSDFRYGFRSSQSTADTADLLTVVSDRIARTFNRSGGLNLIHETLWTGAGSGLLTSMLEKLSLFRLTSLIALVLLMGKWMGLFLTKNHLLRCWG